MGRLAALLVLIVGLVGMHGLASPGPGAGHRLPSPAAVAVAAAPSAGTPEEHSDGAVAAAVLHGSGAQDHAGSPADEHSVLTGCVFVLVGLLVLTALRGVLTRVGGRAVTEPTALAPRAVHAPPHPPPRRPRISLCVLRV